MRFGLVDGLGEEEVGEDCAEGCESGLEVEDYAPGGVGYDYTTDEGAEGGTDQCSGQEPAHGCGPLSGAVDIAEDCGTDDEERGSFEGGKDTEDEKGGEVGRERGAEGATGEEEGGGNADLSLLVFASMGCCGVEDGNRAILKVAYGHLTNGFQ